MYNIMGIIGNIIEVKPSFENLTIFSAPYLVYILNGVVNL